MIEDLNEDSLAKVVDLRAISADVAERASTDVGVRRRQAFAAVSTRQRAADVDQDRTVLALETWHACARIIVERARTNSSIFTRARQAESE